MTRTLVICKPRLPALYTAQRAVLETELGDLAAVKTLFMPVFDLAPIATALDRLREFVVSDSVKPNCMVVFVSPSVLEICLTDMQIWPEHVYCAVMGRQSALLALRLGVPESMLIAPGFGSNEETEDADGLASLIERNFPAGSCQILVCKGPRGRVDFPEKLKTIGHGVSVLECYTRDPIQQDRALCTELFNLNEQAVLWVTSSETMEALNVQLSIHSRVKLLAFRLNAVVLTTHPRIAAKCRELGYDHVIEIATGIQSVKSWIKLNTITW